MAAFQLDSLAVLRAVAGDRDALENVLTAIEPPLRRYIARLMLQPDPAEDVLQEVLFQICRKIRWLRDPELLRTWAFRIASRQCFRQLRAERRRHEDTYDADTLANPAENFPWEPHLLDWIGALPPASRSVIMLHYLEEMSLGEVASILEIAPGTVKSRLAYGLAHLRRQAAGFPTSCLGGQP